LIATFLPNPQFGDMDELAEMMVSSLKRGDYGIQVFRGKVRRRRKIFRKKFVPVRTFIVNGEGDHDLRG
jgi:hypothetical protein